MKPLRRWSWPRITRDAVLFTVGLAGLVFLLVTKDHPDSGLLVLLGGMMGLPAFLQQGDKRRNPDPEPDSPDGREWSDYERWRREQRHRRWRG